MAIELSGTNNPCKFGFLQLQREVMMAGIGSSVAALCGRALSMKSGLADGKR